MGRVDTVSNESKTFSSLRMAPFLNVVFQKEINVCVDYNICSYNNQASNVGGNILNFTAVNV